MTDESQPDNVEDPKRDQDEQALAGTGNEEQVAVIQAPANG